MNTEQRRVALARALADIADAILVTKLVNARYLTGFTGSAATVLVPVEGPAVLATDGRYSTQAAAESPDLELAVTRSGAATLIAHARKSGVRRLAVEQHHVTVSAYDAMRAAAGDDIELVAAGECVEALRAVKDDAEIEQLATACRVTDEAFTAVLQAIRPGITERDVSWLLREQMRRREAEPAFDSIVAFGANSARPHHQPTDRALEAGDFVKMDFGAQVNGYHADMTRTVVCGTPADWQRELHGIVSTIQQQSRAEIRPGAVPVDLDAAMRARIEASGHSVAHGLGHGVGLEIHESPLLVAESTAARLVDRVAVTVEPGIYLPGQGGVRIEDTVLVSADGAEPLTASPRELIEI